MTFIRIHINRPISVEYFLPLRAVNIKYTKYPLNIVIFFSVHLQARPKIMGEGAYITRQQDINHVWSGYRILACLLAVLSSGPIAITSPTKVVENTV